MATVLSRRDRFRCLRRWLIDIYELAGKEVWWGPYLIVKTWLVAFL